MIRMQIVGKLIGLPAVHGLQAATVRHDRQQQHREPGWQRHPHSARRRARRRNRRSRHPGSRTGRFSRGGATSQGVPVADDQNSLKQGARGPALLEDFHFREKIFHFDRKASLAGSWGMARAKKGDAKAFIAALTPLRFWAREPLVDQDALPA